MKHDHQQFLVLKDRAAERIPIETEAVVRRDGAPDLVVRVSNISAGGFRCSSPERLEIGSNVTLHLEGVGDFQARVAWQLGHDAGVRFESAMSWSRIFSVLLRAVTFGRGTGR